MSSENKLNEKKYHGEVVKTDCRHFNGYKPCKPHKQYGVHCKDCKYYSPMGKKILIIKKAAAGEVVRNTPILHKLRELYPTAHITWITQYPTLIPKKHVDRVLSFEHSAISMLEKEEFDIVYSLDKEIDSCTIAKTVGAELKKGFTLDRNNNVVPIDKDAEFKFVTGIFDDLMRASKKHYIEETFEVCGWKFNGEEYILPEYPEFTKFKPDGKKVIGLNTGASETWKTRIWPVKNWISLIDMIKKQGHTPVLLGGPDEHEKNQILAKETGALYFGTMPLREFIGVVDKCDLVVTVVSLDLHLAIGLKKPVVLMVNIFPKNEFHLYGKGRILEPNLACQACYKTDFDDKCLVDNCMERITPEQTIDAIGLLLE